MKKYMIVIFMLMNTYSLLNGAFSIGEMTVYDISTYFNTTGSIYWFSDSQEYKNGGIVFNFPAQYFTQAPRVFVAVQPILYSIFGVLSPQITFVDKDSVEVRLNVIAGSARGEALDNTAIITVFALGY